MPLHIPIEIYPLIFQHIASNAILSNLCTVSRAFRDEAQRILYHTVRLPPDRDCMTSWCDAVVENPGLAMHVYALYLPTTIRHNPLFKTEIDSMLQKLRQAVKRALFSLSRLAELHTYSSWGRRYLNFDIFCGLPFHLQVVAVEPNPPGTLEHYLKFLSEQPAIRHWRLNVLWGHPLDPDVLPLLTSAHIHSSALDIISRCPMIRALRVEKSPQAEFCNQLLMLKAFRHTLAGLSVGYSNRLAVELAVIRDTVPNIKFLELRPHDGVSIAWSVPVRLILMCSFRYSTHQPTYFLNSQAFRISLLSYLSCRPASKINRAGLQTWKRDCRWRRVSWTRTRR
jgi:hypothetical protein